MFIFIIFYLVYAFDLYTEEQQTFAKLLVDAGILNTLSTILQHEEAPHVKVAELVAEIAKLGTVVESMYTKL